MGSEVLYRKWRPQALAEVVGQEPITRTLRNAIEKGRIAHAYLFCGPRGTGKTSTGRILAKAVNCLDRRDGEPCNVCDTCRAITEGRDLDVIEIDAASNRGIDEIRSLREKVNYAPGRARYKVYIIDEVHMLTEPACNALLKTLEEPPAHVIFVLATTEAHKVMPTLVSRCQRFNFHRLSQEDVVSRLELICRQEQFRIGPDSLRLIARAATGSLRDAENIVQQLVAYHGNDVSYEQARSALGGSGDARVKQLAHHVVGKDVTAGLRVINQVASDGLDLRQFTLELVDYLRALLLVKFACEEALDLTGEDLAEVRGLAADAPEGYLFKVVKSFSTVDFRADNYSALPLEMALVDCVLAPAATSGETVSGAAKKEASRAQASHGEPAAEGMAAGGPKAEEETPLPAPVAPFETGPGDAGPEFLQLSSRWREFIQALRGEGSSGNLDAFLRSACEPVTVEDDTLVLGFYYSFHKEKIEDAKYRHLVEKKLKEVFGKPYKIRCVLVDQKNKAHSAAVEQSPLVNAALGMGATIADE